MSFSLITGANRGIGLEYVRQLAANASNTVVALVRSASAANPELEAAATAGPGKIHILECDVSSSASISALPGLINSTLGADTKFDLVINNAAILHSQTLSPLDVTPDAVFSHMTTNLIGPMLTFQVLQPFLKEGSKIANISSGAGCITMTADGRMKSLRPITAYSISKAALNMLTACQAKHMEPKGVVVVAVDPGWVKTKMGGPGAQIEIADSARDVLKTLDGLTMKDTAKFVLYNGTELPW